MDPTLWKNPREFKPERFLNSQGAVEEPPYFMPFSVGQFYLTLLPISLFTDFSGGAKQQFYNGDF